MTLNSGARLGPYEIVSALGSGGMGDVYRARDTRLQRTVAIKVLSPELAGDHELRGRFEREARTIAALDHPHICAVYDVGEQDGVHYLVMPHLEGETLAERLARAIRGLPLPEVLTIGGQIADALDKTHRAGITHRDLKPANIMLTKAGAKLLDFGVAKLRPAAPISTSGLTGMATATRGTASGTILGTVPYMAPEQLEGRDADARSDIWALGTVLYEMTTGARPFSGDSLAGMIGAILKDDAPRVSARQPLVPPPLDQLIQHCLAKEPDARWQSAADLGLYLKSIESARDAAAPRPVPRHRRILVSIAGVGAVLLAAAAAALLGTPSRVVATDPRVATVARVTHEAGFSEWPTWSPDGSLFAFTSDRAGNFDLYVGRAEGGREVVNVTSHAADDVQPAFAPDGKSIAFVSTRSSQTGLIKMGTFLGFDTRTYGGDVWVTPALGGQARRLAQGGNFPVWHPNGREVIYVTGPDNQRAIMTASVDGGAAPAALLRSSDSTWEIIRLGFSPDGRWITFETNHRQIMAMPAAGGRPMTLLTGSGHVWDRSARRFYYANEQSTGGTRIEAAELEPGELPRVVRIWVGGVSTGTLRDLALAPDGTRLLATAPDESLNLTRIRVSPDGADTVGPEEPLSTGHVRDRYPAVSPDGERIVVSTNRIGDNELWIVVPSSGRWTRVEMPEVPEELVTHACWGPNGRDLGVKRFLRDGTAAHWRIAVDGSAAEPLGQPAPALAGTFGCAFSPDGQQLLYSRIVEGSNQLFVVDLTTRRDRQLTHSGSHKYQGAWSPDGRWIAFSANTGGTVHVWRMPAGGGPEEQLTTGAERHMHMFYSPDGRWLYVQPSHRNIYRMPADGGPLQPVTHFPESRLFIEEPTIAATGQYLAYNRGRGGSSLWMLTFAAAGSEAGQ